ncbi:unnamed protein product [Brassica oleracea]
MLDWMHGNFRLSLALSVVELLVDMDCQGCETKVRRAISKLDGVDTVEIDVDQQKVTVTGYIDREEVLRIVKRTGRGAESSGHSRMTDITATITHILLINIWNNRIRK